MTGNPNGRPRLDSGKQNLPGRTYTASDVQAAVADAVASVRLDGWHSLLTALGTTEDKSVANTMSVEPINDEEARMIYRGDSFGARIAEARPREMFRAGWKLKISDADVEKKRALETADGEVTKLTRADSRKLRRRLDALASKTKDLSERAMNRARDLQFNAKLKRALVLANVDGGSAILIGANDGSKDWKQPLRPDALAREEQLQWLTVIEARHLEPVAWYNNPQAAKYGEVAIWRINPSVEGAGVGVDPKFVPKAIEVHESRLIVFQGIRLTDSQVEGTHTGFGDSVYTRLKPTLGRYSIGWNSAAILLNEFSLSAMKIKGLAEMASQDAKKKLMNRMQAIKLGRSITNITLLDKDEELTRDTATVTGLADLLFALMQDLAGQADVPVTILMGMSPAGMNATGESDTRGWYDRIAGEWNEKMDPVMRRLVGLLLRTVNKGKEPEKWCVELNPLWQESPKEKAETAKVWAEVDQTNTTTGVYSVEEARRSRYQGDEFGTDIVIDNDEMEPERGEIDPDMEEAKKMAAEGALDPKAPPKKPGEPAPAASPSSGTQPGGADIQKQAMNGAQVTSLIEVVRAAVAQEIPRESAQAIIELAFQLSPTDATRVLGPEGFEPKKEEPAMPFGGGGFGGPPNPPQKPGSPIPNGKNPPEKTDSVPSGKDEKPEPPKPPVEK